MALDRNNFNLFGLDLLQIPAFWRQGWSEALRWKIFSRLLPAEPVRLLLPDGSESGWPVSSKLKGAKSLAIVLPEDMLLRRTLVLPALSAGEQQQALELALQSASPFPPEKIVWGFHETPVSSGVRIDLALCSRDHVASHIDQVFNRSGPSNGAQSVAVSSSVPIRTAAFEVWASGEPLVVIRGYGEHLRMARQRRHGWALLAMACVCMVLVLALIASPVLNKRQHVLELNTALEAVSREVAPVVAERDVLGKQNLRLQSVAAYLDARPDPRLVLGRLSTLLPDTVYLTRFEIRGRTVTISGLAENAAGLMESLGSQSDFRDVKAPAAITRDSATGRESFTLEFKLMSVAGNQ